MPEQPMRSVKAQEKIWKEEEDVRTLSHAQEIQKDKPRLTAATKRATVMAKDVKAQAVKLENVAKKKPVRKASTKRVVSRTVGNKRRR